jgi:hypothetical protein
MTQPEPPVAARDAHTPVASRLLRAAVFAAVCVVLSATGHVLGSTATVPWWTLAVAFGAVFALAAPMAGRTRSLPSITFALTGGQLALHALFGLGQSHAGSASADGRGPLSGLAAQLMCGGGTAANDTRAPGAPAGAVPDPSAGGHAGHTVPGSSGTYDSYGALGTDGGQGATGTAAECLHSLIPSLPMLLGHLLAALATGWLLRHGDLALRRLALLSTRGAEEVAAEALVRSLRAALAFVRTLLAGLSGAPAHGPRPAPASFRAPVRLTERALQHSVIRRGPPAAAYSLAA